MHIYDKTPPLLEDIIERAIKLHNRECRIEGGDDFITYYNPYNSISNTRKHYLFVHTSNPTSLVISFWYPNANNYKEEAYSITTNDPSFEAFIRPLVDEFLNQLGAYYKEYEDQRKTENKVKEQAHVI